MIHIATDETFLHDAPVLKMACIICETTCDHELGWVGARCSNCKQVWNLEETMPDVVTRRRTLLNLTRKQMSDLTGYKPSTIKRYEWVRCTKAYFQKTSEIFNQLFK